jgi:hypothetical protein
MYCQPGVNSPGVYAGKEFSAGDCFNKARYKGIFSPDSLKANMVLSGQRIWRVVSLDDKENKLLLNTNKGCEQVGLFEVMKFGLIERRLNAFDSDDFNEAKKSRLTQQQKVERMTLKDSSEVVTFDAEGNEKKEMVKVNRFYMGTDIVSFLIKEDWVFNAVTSQTVKYIIAFAPLVVNPKTGGLQPLYWLYYPEWRELLGCFNTKSAFADEPMPYAEIFAKRKFVSQITKESNVYDRSVRSVHHGDDIKVKTDKIKDNLNNKEADHFDH